MKNMMVKSYEALLWPLRLACRRVVTRRSLMVGQRFVFARHPVRAHRIWRWKATPHALGLEHTHEYNLTHLALRTRTAAYLLEHYDLERIGDFLDRMDLLLGKAIRELRMGCPSAVRYVAEYVNRVLVDALADPVLATPLATEGRMLGLTNALGWFPLCPRSICVDAADVIPKGGRDCLNILNVFRHHLEPKLPQVLKVAKHASWWNNRAHDQLHELLGAPGAGAINRDLVDIYAHDVTNWFVGLSQLLDRISYYDDAIASLEMEIVQLATD